MAALAGLGTNSERVERGGRKFDAQDFAVANGVAVRGYALIGIGGVDHATPGEIRPWAPAVGLIFAGILNEPVLDPTNLANPSVYTGDGTNTPINRKSVLVAPGVLERQTVAGATSEAQEGVALVYCATDNLADLTLTPTSPAVPVGIVAKYRSTGIADVLFFGLEAQIEGQVVGQSIDVISVYMDLAQLGSGTAVGARFLAPYALEVLGTSFNVQEVLAGSGSAAISLETPDGALTGGVTTVLSTDAFAALKSGTAVTSNAAARANTGDTVIVNVTTTMNPSAGSGTLFVRVRRLPAA